MNKTTTIRDYKKDFNKNKYLIFNITYKESDINVLCDKNTNSEIKKKAFFSLIKYRNLIESHIHENKNFLASLKPIDIPNNTTLHPLLIDMYRAATIANTGPFAAVAGAIAEYIAKDLSEYSKELIVENGGDIFLIGSEDKYVKIKSLNDKKLAIVIESKFLPISVCSSSSKIGHSLSYGQADLVTVISKKGSVADAFATAICNNIKEEKDIEKTIAKYKKNKYIYGCLIFFKDKIAGWGNINLVKVS